VSLEEVDVSNELQGVHKFHVQLLGFSERKQNTRRRDNPVITLRPCRISCCNQFLPLTTECVEEMVSLFEMRFVK